MLLFIQENAATILITIILTIFVVLAVRHIIKENHKGGCSGQCSSCPYRFEAGDTHDKNDVREDETEKNNFR